VKFTIEQAAEMVGVHKSTLRYWGKIFALNTPRSAGNQRRYPLEQVELLKRIKALFDEGMTTRGVRMRLKEGAHADKVA
jgi:DNA-binding transcriptional MerR regulator